MPPLIGMRPLRFGDVLGMRNDHGGGFTRTWMFIGRDHYPTAPAGVFLALSTGFLVHWTDEFVQSQFIILDEGPITALVYAGRIKA